MVPIIFDGTTMRVVYPTNSKFKESGLNYNVSVITVINHGIFFDCFEFDKTKKISEQICMLP
jgi:hypothetical protein